MEKDEIFNTLAGLIGNYVETPADGVKPESRFIEDLGFTSFDFMTMLGEVEDELDVEVNPEELEGIITV
ncbi:MAG: phosphopantetheine-binding protein, partial [Clostridiales bacterium]|nr:phosphopantetheine-binding protein [Clostridiales bacterium]